ncbi:MAG: hypothetical protein HUJ79_02300, partial [Firmicutes bacterium]|nr:hypothetical protein [Bacillota bacterium]
MYPKDGDALSDNYTITLIRVTDIKQEIDFPNKYPWSAMERADDRITMILQEQAQMMKDAVKVSVTSDIEDLRLPPAEPNAILQWNDDGTGFKNTVPVAFDEMRDMVSSVEESRGTVNTMMKQVEASKNYVDSVAKKLQLDAFEVIFP